ncbi:methyltransferase family protein [Actinocrispum wychmicini]|uniref:Protein-S-isoprenylcysteine O-methyltransferase Ste14 n=1 Tax=Actinocrispum wychmicini TaxID=1213861 RepID=A0A4R2K0Y9_9PSEU|nr:isoprenylcysteine carboxylmethyltransferase family protein [Actinocrispum wychmicini]TCO65954.1 protein-S-isoprenylcysteine O-methyltransferase Ste14 [Actinocrispum wychmicini]
MTVLTDVVRGLLFAAGTVWLIVELVNSRRSRAEAVTADHGSRVLLHVAVGVGFAVAIGLWRVVPATAVQPTVAAWVGLGILACGVALRVWSFRTLGRYFTYSVQTSDDQPVISTGPYRVVRHPSYVGLLLVVVGTGMSVANWLSIISLTAIMLSALVYRVVVEDRVLLRELGQRYRDYAATHKRLIPFIW